LESQDGLFGDDEVQLLTASETKSRRPGTPVAAQARAKQLRSSSPIAWRFAETKYATLMRHANDAIFVVDSGGTVLEVKTSEAMLAG